jgi:hypothetical protein
MRLALLGELVARVLAVASTELLARDVVFSAQESASNRKPEGRVRCTTGRPHNSLALWPLALERGTVAA